MNKAQSRDANKFVTLAKKMSRAAAWTVIIIALGALIGGRFEVDLLTRWMPGLAPMLPGTSLGCFLAAASLLLLQDHPRPANWRRRTGQTLAWVVAVLAGSGLLHELFRLPNTSLTADYIPIAVSFTGLCIAAAILLTDVVDLRVSTILASFVVFCALLALLGYLYGDRTLYGGGTRVPLSLPSIVCFLLLGLSTFTLRAGRGASMLLFGHDIAGYVLRRLQLAAVVLPVVIGLLVLGGRHAGWYSIETAVALLVAFEMAALSYLAWTVTRTVHQLDQQRHEAQQTVAHGRKRLSLIMQSLPVGVVLVEGPRYNVVLSNAAAVELLGHDPRGKGLELSRMHRADGQPYPPEDLPLSVALKTGQTVIKNDLIYSRPDGTEINMRTTAAPLQTDPDAVAGLLILEDYTKEQQVERAKDEFLGLATHQLQTPLTGVAGFLAMLRDGLAGPLNDEQLELVREAYDGNDRERHIVADLLNVGRAESGRMVLKKSDTDLSVMVTSIIHEQDTTIRARRQTAGVKAPRQPVLAFVDPARLRMVIENLVSNASKYTKPGGHLEIRLRQTAQTSSITIADSGVGIAPSDIPKLFRRFSRIDNELSQKVGGTGLGLYLAKQIVELHGGHIAVKSEPSKGTEFTIQLPRVRSH